MFWLSSGRLPPGLQVVPTEVDFKNTFSTYFQRVSELVKIHVDLKVNLCGDNSQTNIVVRETACTVVFLDYSLEWIIGTNLSLVGRLVLCME